MKLLITTLLLLCFSATAFAADVVTHDITIVPGKSWQMVVQWKLKASAPTGALSNYYVAYVGNGPLFSDKLLARMSVESSTVDPTAVLLQLTAEQTTALAGKECSWSLIYLPDLGTALLIARGEVKS